MNMSTEHILQCNQSEPLADASGRIVDLMNENYIGRERLNLDILIHLRDNLITCYCYKSIFCGRLL